MTRNKLFALFVLGAAVALTSAVPASARDREDRAPRSDSRRLSTSTPARGILPSVKTSGGDPSDVRIHSERSPITPARPSFFQKAECTGSCGSITFTCSGSDVYCQDGAGCVASGGGVTLVLVCVAT